MKCEELNILTVLKQELEKPKETLVRKTQSLQKRQENKRHPNICNQTLHVQIYTCTHLNVKEAIETSSVKV